MVQNVVLKLSFGELKFEFSQLECLCVLVCPPFLNVCCWNSPRWGQFRGLPEAVKILILSPWLFPPPPSSSHIFQPFFSIFKGQPTRTFSWDDSPLVFTLSYLPIYFCWYFVEKWRFYSHGKSNIHNCPFKYSVFENSLSTYPLGEQLCWWFWALVHLLKKMFDQRTKGFLS